MVATLDLDSIVKLHRYFEENIQNDVSVRSNQETLIEYGKKFAANWRGKEVLPTWEANKVLVPHPEIRRKAALILYREAHQSGVVWIIYSGKENVGLK